jgi:hypothetical protein
MNGRKMFTGDFGIVDASIKQLVASQYPKDGEKECFNNVWIGLELPFGIL